MAASCISVSLGAAAALVVGRSFQASSSSQAARHGFAAPFVCGSSDSQRKLILGFGLGFLGSKAAKNGGIVARAVELEENKDGFLFTDDEFAVAGVSSSDDEPAAIEAAPIPAAADAKLYVGNLPWSVDSKQLAEVFQGYGDVELVEVIYDKETQRSRGFAFVTMGTIEDAERAIEKLDGSELGGRVLKVNFPQSPKEPRSFRNDGPPSKVRRDGGGYSSRSAGALNSENRIFLGNLAWGVDDVAVNQLVSEYGQVVDARVIHDRETGRSRGFAYATMAAAADVETAIQALDGTEYEGRVLRVNRAGDKPDRKPRTSQ